MKKRRLKRRSLKARFNSALRTFQNRIIEEQAFKESRGFGTIEAFPQTFFKKFSYEQIFKEGVTRKKNNVTIKITGEEAIYQQIKSFRSRGNKNIQKNRFIKNYLISLKEIGISENSIKKVERAMQKVNNNYLSLIIDNNTLPQISFVYAGIEEEEKLVERILSSLGESSSQIAKENKQELIEIERQLPKRIKNVKERFNIK